MESLFINEYSWLFLLGSLFILGGVIVYQSLGSIKQSKPDPYAKYVDPELTKVSSSYMTNGFVPEKKWVTVPCDGPESVKIEIPSEPYEPFTLTDVANSTMPNIISPDKEWVLEYEMNCYINENDINGILVMLDESFEYFLDQEGVEQWMK